jgi:hypothetical protein
MHRWVKNAAVTLWAGLVFLYPIGKYVFEKLADHLKWWEHPSDTATTFLEAIEAVWRVSWVPWAIFFLTGFLIGLVIDPFLRKIDGSTKESRRALGKEMLKAGAQIAYERKSRTDLECFEKFTPILLSLGVSASKAGLWYPMVRSLKTGRKDGLDIILDYLNGVGQMLSDGHFEDGEYEAERLRRSNGLSRGWKEIFQR